VRELLSLLDDNTGREAQGRLAQEVARRWFSSEVMMRSYVELYQSLM
jgi:hypothetical protein